MNLGFRGKPKFYTECSLLSFSTILILEHSLINVNRLSPKLLYKKRRKTMFYRKVMDYCKENNLSVMAFEQKCGLTNGTVSKWKDDGNPRLETLMKIVNATGIPAEKWLE